MKKLLACSLLLMALVGCAAHVPVSSPTPAKKRNDDHSISFTWNQSFANNGACSATVTTSCISGFNEGYLSGATQVQLHSDTSGVCTGATQPEPCASTFNGVLPIGAVVFYVATTYVDQSGVAGVTAIATSSPVQVGADASTNVKVVVQ